MKKIYLITLSAIALLPNLALAVSINNLTDLIGVLVGMLNNLVPVLIGLAVVYFLWGIVTYLSAAGNEEKRTESIKVITYGILGLFVMVSFWGLVNIIRNTFFGGWWSERLPNSSLDVNTNFNINSGVDVNKAKNLFNNNIDTKINADLPPSNSFKDVQPFNPNLNVSGQ